MSARRASVSPELAAEWLRHLPPTRLRPGSLTASRSGEIPGARLEGHLRFRRAIVTGEVARQAWEAHVDRHDGDEVAALGEVVAVLADAGLLPETPPRRSW